VILRYVLHNDTVREASEPCLTLGQVGLLAGWGVFSTIRVASGVLFEFDRHYARMQRDARNLRVPFPEDRTSMHERLLELVRANEAAEATLRVLVVRNDGSVFHGPLNRKWDMLAMMAPLANWGESVRLGVVPHARHAQSRFVGTKVNSWAFNLTWYEEAHLNGFDEVVLLNEHGNVSECTSANIFAARDGQVWTPPLSSGCLAGVTRELLLSEVKVPGITVSERDLTLKDLESADEVFITSTTRDLRLVETIDGLQIRRSGWACGALNSAFRRHIEAYVATRLRTEESVR
jgi:branched-chain amino acid aminotransferase